MIWVLSFLCLALYLLGINITVACYIAMNGKDCEKGSRMFKKCVFWPIVSLQSYFR